MKKILFSLVCAFLFILASASTAYAVPVRTYGGVNATSGNYYLQSDNTGNGNLNPGSQVTVDSYVFQCKSSGSAACSTEWNSDATLVQKFQNTVTVPGLNQRTSQITHTFSLPYGQCGRVQYDQGIVGIPGAVGGWVYDFGRSCDNASPAPSASPSLSCSGQLPVLIQFRTANTGQWQSGSSFGTSLRPNQAIDINCFAKNGTALLDGGYIDVTLPDGQHSRVSNTAEARNYVLNQGGSYNFTCASSTMSSCTSADYLSVNLNPTPRPHHEPQQPATSQQSSCNSLQVVGGNNSLVPAKVTLRTSASDNKGNIQSYRYYFGDGQQQETTQAEVQHDYNVSGNFIARVDVKDSQGNWKTNSSCETTVYVQSSSIESAKSDCSDVYITADNGGKVPSKVTFNVTGYDNKGSIQAYKVDFGNGVAKESNASYFEQVYDRPGTYPIYAYIKNSSGNWVGGDDSCYKTLTIGSNRPLTVQPSTGTPTALPLLGFGSGIIGLSIEAIKRKIKA
jgi:hypothetical protein